MSGVRGFSGCGGSGEGNAGGRAPGTVPSGEGLAGRERGKGPETGRNLGQMIRTFKPASREVAWPSGLRRWIKAPVSSGAWVRIPPLPRLFSFIVRLPDVRRLFFMPEVGSSNLLQSQCLSSPVLPKGHR